MRRLDGVHADISETASPRRVAPAVHSRSEKHHHGAPAVVDASSVAASGVAGRANVYLAPSTLHAFEPAPDGPELHRNARGSRGDSRGRHRLRRLFRDEPRGDWRDGANLGDAPPGRDSRPR